MKKVIILLFVIILPITPFLFIDTYKKTQQNLPLSLSRLSVTAYSDQDNISPLIYPDESRVGWVNKEL